MKRLLGIFVLSNSQQRIIVGILLALVIAALARHEREAHRLPFPKPKVVASPSPTPPELGNEQ
ncbi:MAG: hypothetical protein M3O66_04305 [Verrucomicrobiota bacterium]|jgi:hypothetical protein|nr:hypothetical protein [Verrucomicrobiota bacterium]